MFRKYHVTLHSQMGPKKGTLMLKEDRGAITGMTAACAAQACGTVEGAPGLDDAGEWQTNTYMMGQSDFCICDLAAAPDGYRIRDFVSRTERTVILDLGGEQFAGEGP